MSNQNTDSKEGNIISLITFRFLPYWPLFLVLAIIGAAGAWGYVQYTNPLYQASATILLKDDKKGADASGVDDALNLLSSKKIVENEMQVIQSIRLLRKVVDELGLYAQIYEVGKLKQAPAYSTSPIIIVAKNSNSIKNTAFQSFTVRNNSEVVINGKKYQLNEWVQTPFGELKFMPNENQIDKPTNPLMFRLRNPLKVATSLSGTLKVASSNKLSSVLTVTLTDEVKQRAEDIVNKLIQVYNVSSLEDKNTIAQNTLAFVDSRLHEVERELDSLEGRIQQYRSRKGVVDLGEQSRQFLQNVGDYDRKVADISVKLSVLNEVERYVNSKDVGSGLIPSTVGVDDPALSHLVQQLYTAQIEYEKLRKTTGDKNPMVTPLAKEIEQIRPQIMESIRNQKKSLLASKTNVSAYSGAYNSMLNTIPQKERELAEISRQQEIKNSVYSFLLQKREQTAFSISSNMSDSKIIDQAIASDKPVSPNIPKIYLFGLIGAIMLGIVIISVKEFLTRKILFRAEIEKLTALPVVAEISNVKKKDSLLHSTSNASLSAEQFRQLRAAIGLYGKHKNHKRLLVTSSISGEGKSYISASLAASFAMSGKKVILIDFDLRNPKISNVMGVANEAGVAEFLQGDKTPVEIIRETKYPNLYVISAGGEYDNNSELLLNGSVRDLLDSIHNDFDYIVMDTSPIDPVTDAYVFSDYCDQTIFVVRHAYTPKTVVQLFDENSKVKALKNPIIVFNDVRSRGFLNRTYGYGYGYGYATLYRERGRKEEKKVHDI
jgi:capsular exopolysaccharide synthesis family protein